MTELNTDIPQGKKFHICFVALNAYAYLKTGNIEFAGGAERQQVLIAQELARRGHHISFLVNDCGQQDVEKIGEISIYKNTQLKWKHYIILFRIKQFFHFWNTLEKTGSDIYYQRTASALTGNVALFCLACQKKFVYSIAHNFDVDGTCIHESYLPKDNKIVLWLLKATFALGLRLADCVIAQNYDQLSLLQKNYTRKGVVIRSIFCPVQNAISDIKPTDILWVASIQTWKRPEIFLELARKIPKARFRMIGGPSINKEYFISIQKQAQEIPNLEFTGFVSPKKIWQYYQNAKIFVNTSKSEGFPNTFLEAWAQSVPVVSLDVDPDEILCKNKIGFHAKTFDQLVKDVQQLLENEELRIQLGKNGRTYIEREHSIESIAGEYEKIFEKICR